MHTNFLDGKSMDSRHCISEASKTWNKYNNDYINIHQHISPSLNRDFQQRGIVIADAVELFSRYVWVVGVCQLADQAMQAISIGNIIDEQQDAVRPLRRE